MGVVLAHPVTGHPHVDVPLVLVLSSAAAGLAVVAVATRTRRHERPSYPDRTFSWQGPLSGGQRVTRGVTLVLMVLAAVAGRVGVDDELENLAPALVVGAAWPVLVIGTLLLGPVWRWVDPWDMAARALAGADDSRAPQHVWPAVALMLPLVWFLAVHPRPFDPRAVGLAVAGYSLVTVAGCLVAGRRRWLASAEPVGLTLTWLGLAARGRLPTPPAGGEALVGVLAGGLLFGIARRTELFIPVATSRYPVAYATGLFLVACAGGAAVLIAPGLAGRTSIARDRLRTATLTGSLVAVAGIALVAALDRNRLTTSLQLLPGLLGDPLGWGWDLFGSPIRLDPDPLGAAGLLGIQIAVLLLAHLWGAYLACRLLPRSRRLPVLGVLGYTAALSTVTVSLH